MKLRAIVSLLEKLSSGAAPMHFLCDDIGLCYLDRQTGWPQRRSGITGKEGAKVGGNTAAAVRTPAQFMRPFRRCDSDVGHHGMGCGVRKSRKRAA